VTSVIRDAGEESDHRI